MCGLNGIFAYNHSASLPDRAELIATRDHMQARGPDGLGEWWDEDRRVGLGHRRLAIFDLSDRARQPMVSACSRYIIVFNGEIYNYRELRAGLERQGVQFRTNSDTEVMLALFVQKREAMVHDLRGMFAFAIWDCLERSLFLARDPYGIKPLYTSNDGWTFRFASQVKALLAGGKISKEPEPAGVVGFLLQGSVPEPFTLYRDIRQLPAGHTQIVDAAGPRSPRPFCSISEILAEGARQPAPPQEVQSIVTQALRDSVRAHLLADVEVGLFLSRGVDSGALLGIVHDLGHERIRTINLSFEEYAGSAWDEAPMARAVAELYGSNHLERSIGRQDFREELPKILEAMDQPSIDGVNVWFIAKSAQEAGLKVALSGIGGDELFAGYPSFKDVPRAVRVISPFMAVPGAGLAWRHALKLLRIASDRPKYQGLLEFGGSYPGAYLLRRGLFLPFELDAVLDAEIVRCGLNRLGVLEHLDKSVQPDPGSATGRIVALESANYMRCQLLRDADWAGMAHGLEIRTPFVDIDLLRKLSPVVPLLGYRDKKKYLANAPKLRMPSAMAAPKKLGFVVPTERWTAEADGGQEGEKGLSSRVWGLNILSKFELSQFPRSPNIAESGSPELAILPIIDAAVPV